MRIVLTGTPGTGKSTIARKLTSSLGLELIDLAAIARSAGLVGKGHEVDIGKLKKALSFLKKTDGFLAEGHLACEVPVPCDFIFVLRSRPDVLKRRMTRRGYGKTKIAENVLAEALDYCSQRAEKVYRRRPIEVETSGRSPAATAALIERAIKNKKKTIDKVDYSDYLRKIALE